MDDGRNPIALVRIHSVYLRHEGHVRVDLEVVGHSFAQNARSKRPEGFTSLDLAIEGRLHVGASWIAKDAAVSERPGTPFHPPLKPSHHQPLAYPLRDGLTEVL